MGGFAGENAPARTAKAHKADRSDPAEAWQVGENILARPVCAGAFF